MKLGSFKTNNIYCADSYKAIKELPDKCIDLIVTDPPYLIENTNAGNNSTLSKSIQKMNDELLCSNLVGGGNNRYFRRFYKGFKNNKYLYMV